MINRKSVTIKIKITSGKESSIIISSYTSLSSEDSQKMTNDERLNYLKSERIIIKDSNVSLFELTSGIEKLMKIYTENVKSNSIIWNVSGSAGTQP
jgi:hypothetical protein